MCIREGFSKLFPESGICVLSSPLDYPSFCDVKFRIIKNPGLSLSLAVIACLQVDKIELNSEFFQSTDTTYWIAAINQLLEWQSITSNVYPHCQNWGEFPIRKPPWSESSSQQQREAVSLQGEEGTHAVVKQQFLPTLSSWGRAWAVVLERAANCFPTACHSAHHIHHPPRKGREATWKILENKTHRIPPNELPSPFLLPQFNTHTQTRKWLKRIFLNFGTELKIYACLL